MADSDFALPWNPEIDTPATIAILGGGRAGIEAALYARFLGYDVWLFERDRPGQAWRHQFDVPMDGNWEAETSPLGRAALEAQGTPLDVDLGAHPTYGEYLRNYLTPLAKTDLVYDSVQIRSNVRSISRCGIPPGSALPAEEQADLEFRLLVDSATRGQHHAIADIVLDCGGLAPLGGLAPGGGMAAGQDLLEPNHLATRRCADTDAVLGAAQGGRIVLVGNSVAAVRCAQLLRQCEGERVSRWTWLVPAGIEEGEPTWSHLPRRLVEAALELVRREASEHGASLEILGIERVSRTADGQWNLELRRRADETLEMQGDDLIVAPPQWPDWQLCQPLFAFSPAAGAPLAGAPFLTSQPHYYVLGSKADRRARAEFGRTLDHIRAVFARIGGRRDLDLYKTIRPQS